MEPHHAPYRIVSGCHCRVAAELGCHALLPIYISLAQWGTSPQTVGCSVHIPILRSVPWHRVTRSLRWLDGAELKKDEVAHDLSGQSRTWYYILTIQN